MCDGMDQLMEHFSGIAEVKERQLCGPTTAFPCRTCWPPMVLLVHPSYCRAMWRLCTPDTHRCARMVRLFSIGMEGGDGGTSPFPHTSASPLVDYHHDGAEWADAEWAGPLEIRTI